MKPEFTLKIRHDGNYKANDFDELVLLVNGKLAEKYKGVRIVRK